MKSFEIGSLILRVYLGLAFFIHGFAKYQGGVENTAGWFESMGIPGFMAYMVTAIEIVGGLLLIAGLGTRYITPLFFIIMIVVILKVKLSEGFSAYELDITYAAIALFLFLNSKSSFSLDAKLTNKKAA
ncbi:DoxX family protein [uncultured Metabacillus sp.]|uniref:DoxX family protein n=1 Tax=uncultured Metabacillus sp. TaxID=2860135 RepID=UPI0026261723|nr:DoxX family protein [uncultured Metabacillus sp.]